MQVSIHSTLSLLSDGTRWAGHAHWLPDLLQELKEAWPATRLCLQGTKESCSWDMIRGCLLLHLLSQLPNIYCVAVL